MGIANSVLEAVRMEAARYPGTRPRRVGMRIGELAAVDSSALQFCFEALTRDTELEGLELAVETRPRRHRCEACSAEFQIHEYQFQCPRCGEMRSQCIGGDELELAYLEVEEYESSTA